MDKLERIYRFNIELLTRLNIEFREWQHEPILDFATDIMVAQRLGWTGTHSKSLFLRLKGAGYALLLTDKDSRLDSKAIKALTGKRPSIVDDQQMTEVTGCVAGAVCPFGLPSEIPIIVDTRLYQQQEILYTPGRPEATVGFAGQDLATVLKHLDNPILEM
ncbi:YbaK/EbsC family protein [Vibrio sinaloensis]|uniref:YbaK/EbsC family protein n=1 Tax=Photobacterium sp. (strain ATCC 43367) TaxID=379097 RepID=UPI00206AF016|nr:YbaK/EbsC family protein [Vibrio sinaloensis]UPQ87675.1 YbaK/EbsC family protein [Vibrio sinaloensis]